MVHSISLATLRTLLLVVKQYIFVPELGELF